MHSNPGSLQVLDTTPGCANGFSFSGGIENTGLSSEYTSKLETRTPPRAPTISTTEGFGRPHYGAPITNATSSPVEFMYKVPINGLPIRGDLRLHAAYALPLPWPHGC